MTFDKWMNQVDAICQKKYYVSVYDLPDCPFCDWYEDDYSPAQAAAKAYRYARAEGY